MADKIKVKDKDKEPEYKYECDSCGYKFNEKTKHCPECGGEFE